MAVCRGRVPFRPNLTPKHMSSRLIPDLAVYLHIIIPRMHISAKNQLLGEVRSPSH